MPGNVVTTTSATYAPFAPVLHLTRTCCLFPVRIGAGGATTRTISWSWRYYAVSVVTYAAMMAWIIFGLTKSYAIDEVYDIRLKQLSGKFITILDDTYLLLTFTLATVATPVNYHHFCTYVKCLNKVDALLRRHVQGEQKRCLAFLLFVLALTVLVLGLDVGVWWKYVFVEHLDFGSYLLYILPFYCTYFIVMVIEMKYWYLVRMVNVRLSSFNDALSDNYNQYKNLESPTRFIKSVSNLVKVYEMLFEANCAVNDFFGVNVLLVIIGCLIHLLVTPYDLYLELKLHDYTFILPQLCWMVSHVLRLFLIVEPCHKAAQAVKRASSLVCQFMSLDLSQELHFQLEVLATQLFHCPVQYTAYDLVVLDRSLLTKIAGGVTTYLVILFQFDN